jgi:hypothetical protein
LSDSQQSEISDSLDLKGGSAGEKTADSGRDLTGLQLWLSQNREKTMRISITVFVIGLLE